VKVRCTILAILLTLLPLMSCHVAQPVIKVEPVVVEAPAEGMSRSEALWQAMELELQEGLGRLLARKARLSEEEGLRIIQVAYRASVDQEVDVFRILGIIIAESYGNKKAISPVGARGLMQIMPLTGRFIAAAHGEPWRGRNSLYEIELNIRYGVWYYRDLLEAFDGDEIAALAAYNWGPKHVAYRIRHGQALPKVYPGKVLAAEAEVRKEFWNENYSLIWRSYSRAERIRSNRRGASQPEDSSDASHLHGGLPPGALLRRD
jgi:hypothetical protein